MSIARPTANPTGTAPPVMAVPTTPQPLQPRQTAGSIVIFNWRAYEKAGNAKKGDFSAELASGLILDKVALFEQNGSRWLGMPSIKMEGKADEKPAWLPLVRFRDNATRDRFRDQVLAALDQFLGKQEGA